MAVNATLTEYSDIIFPLEADQVVNGTSLTLGSGDQLDGGAGFDVLALSGGGSFNLGSLAKFVGFEKVTLVNETNSNASLYLRDNTENQVIVSRGSSGLSNWAEKPLISVYFGSGKNLITAGNEEDAFIGSDAK